MRKTLASAALAAAVLAPAGVAQAATTDTASATTTAEATSDPTVTTEVTKTETKVEKDRTGLWGLLGLLGLAGLMGGRKREPEVRTAEHVRTYDREPVRTDTVRTTDRAYDADGTRNHLGDGDGRIDADDFRTNGR